jgi:hypothetical protein
MTSYVKMATVQEKAVCVLWFFETKFVTKTQRQYITQYGKDPPPSDNAIRRWLKQFQETGCELLTLFAQINIVRPYIDQFGLRLARLIGVLLSYL